MHKIRNTDILFRGILKLLKPELIFDIEAMDASLALSVRKILPNSHIVAFEANPLNYDVIVADRRLKDNNIKVYQKAAWNADTILKFYIIDPLAPGDRPAQSWG